MATTKLGEQIQKCWEGMNCPEESRKKCNAYHLDGGEDCWFFNDVGIGILSNYKTVT